MRKIGLNVLRIAISLGLLLYLLSLVDVQTFLQTLRDADLKLVFLGLVSLFLAIFFLSFRWKLLLRAHEIEMPLFSLNKFYYIGFFFNNFLPTSIGGDLSRAYLLAKESDNRAVAVGSVFLERIIGLIATLSLAAFSLIWLIKYFSSLRIIYATLILFAAIAIFLAFILSRRLYRGVEKILSFFTFYGIGEKITKVLDTLHFFRNKKGILLGAFGASLLAQFMLITMNFLLARSLGLDQISFGYFFLLVPVTFVLSLLPSINGLGVRDVGYVFLLTRNGLTATQALSLSILVTLLPLVISVAGGVSLLTYRRKNTFPIMSEDKTL